MRYYDLNLDGDQADSLVVAVLKDSLETIEDMIEDGFSDDEDKKTYEALRRVINYFSTPDQHV